MKKWIRIGAALLLLTFLLTACASPQGNTESSDIATEAATESSASETEPPVTGDGTDTEEGGNSTPTEESLVLFENGSTEYTVIRASSLNSPMQDRLQTFIDAIKSKTGVNLKLVTYADTKAPVAKEIIIGNTDKREESAAVSATLGYASYSIKVVGEKIVVNAYSEVTLEKALTKLQIAMKQNKEGQWIMDKNYSYSENLSSAAVDIPFYPAESGKLEGVYYCGEGNYEISVKETSKEAYDAYLSSLAAKGFTAYTENQVGNNEFGTYVSGNTVAHTMYYPSLNTVKVVYGPKAYLPGTEAQAYPTTPVATPSITQIGRDMVWNGYNPTSQTINGAPGMSYVIQLADGRFIVIDGGPSDGQITKLTKEGDEWKVEDPSVTSDMENLLAFLQKKNEGTGHEKPVIAAWFITHAHGDHMALANDFIARYADEVVIEMAAYNFPDFEKGVTLGDGSSGTSSFLIRTFKAAMNTKHMKAKHFVFHTGQKLQFPGCEIEILYTHEDFYPNPMPSANHTSSAFRMTFEGATGNKTTFMVLGDIERGLSQMMADIYGAELKSDICQLSHHGYNGACLDLYVAIAPEICLWASDPYRFETDRRCLGTANGYDFNKWVRENCDIHYCSDVTTTIEIR